MTLKGTNPLYMRHSHVVIHHDDGMEQVDLYQLVLYPDFALCRLHCLFVILLLTCLVACIGCDGKGCTLSGGALDQGKGYKTLFTMSVHHEF